MPSPGSPLALYFALAYAISWVTWAPVILARFGLMPTVSAAYLHLAGGLGPALAALLVSHMAGGRPAFLHLLRRCSTGGVWLVLAAFLPAVLFLASVLIVVAALREPVAWSQLGASTELGAVPRPLYWLASLACYGFGEELGWRGFALPRLQARRSALGASLLLAVGWAGWHLPLFFISPGMSSMNAAEVAGWFASMCLGSILMTWLFNASGGSVAAVALFHASLDIFMMSPVSPHLPGVMGALLTIGSLLVVPKLWARRAADPLVQPALSPADEHRNVM